jgi:hypothetical protein
MVSDIVLHASWQTLVLFLMLSIGLIMLMGLVLRWFVLREIRAMDTRFETQNRALTRFVAEQGKQREEDLQRWHDADTALLKLRAELPNEYVRREDWIRFSAVLEMKLDAVHKRIDDLAREVRDGRT